MARLRHPVHPEIFGQEFTHSAANVGLSPTQEQALFIFAGGLLRTLRKELVQGVPELTAPSRLGDAPHATKTGQISLIQCQLPEGVPLPKGGRWILPIYRTFAYAEINRPTPRKLAQSCGAVVSWAFFGKWIPTGEAYPAELASRVQAGVQERVADLAILGPDNAPPVTAPVFVANMEEVALTVCDYVGPALELPSISIKAGIGPAA